MKKINICVIILGALFFFSACNDEWKDELYTHTVSLKAPVGDDGVASLYLRYKPDGEVIYDLPVLVSGSTLMENAMDVSIGVDMDTLKYLNESKFQWREDLHYKQLEEQYYELLSPTCHIPAGSNKELYQVKFKFAGLDLSKDWVLPLTIEEDPSYIINTRKGWGKALLHILPFNDYSGTYSASAMNIYFDDSNDQPLVVDQRKGYVVDEKAIFFYAGTKQDNAIDRETYKIRVEFGFPSIGEDGTTKRGNLSVTAFHNEIGFETIGQPTYEIREEKDANQPYLVRRYYILYMKYRYNDVTSVPGIPTAYRAEGSLTMERRINILVPDEDQAILW